MTPQLSFTKGGTTPALVNTTLGHVAAHNARQHGAKTYLYAPYQKRELTFSQLYARARSIAKALLATGLQYGDHVGIFLPNCSEHIEIFVACSIIGLPVVSFNLTFTSTELARAAAFVDAKAVFICPTLGSQKLDQHITQLLSLPLLKLLVHVGGQSHTTSSGHVQQATYDTFVTPNSIVSDQDISRAASQVTPQSILNIQFTSGTTGFPKAVLLTHYGMLNNGYLCANALHAQPTDLVIGNGPLFHCMGSIGFFLFSFVAGASLIFPSPSFDPNAILDAVLHYSATVMNGVPTMFLALAETANKRGLAGKITTLRTGFVAGAPASREVVALMADVLGMHDPVIGLGMTEMSMATHTTCRDDPLEKRVSTCGRIMPHTSAKVVDQQDPSKILPVGERGELLFAGYGVCQGYYKQPAKTAEAIAVDEQGTKWLRTGDEAVFDADGFCKITGRIKDIIIRGGENVYPAEIEERLALLPGVAEACVIGVPDERYGEVVAAFLRADAPAAAVSRRPTDEQVRDWVREKLARQKAPRHVFWLGQGGMPEEFPKTGSGKHQKHILRELAAGVVKNGGGQAVRPRL